MRTTSNVKKLFDVYFVQSANMEGDGLTYIAAGQMLLFGQGGLSCHPSLFYVLQTKLLMTRRRLQGRPKPRGTRFMVRTPIRPRTVLDYKAVVDSASVFLGL